jgi:hypothetical protein
MPHEHRVVAGSKNFGITSVIRNNLMVAQGERHA